MPKKDIAVTVSAADRLLKTLTDPLHRQIMENYRRHVILETCGEWEDIFAPDMTIDEPVYYLNLEGFEGVKAVGEEVKAMYKSQAENSTGVMVVEDETIAIADWGFASELIVHTYRRGTELIQLGSTVDPEGHYVHKQCHAMIWPYDDHGRLVGEHVYENKALAEIVEVGPEDFLTVEDARARLLPLLRPLPHYEPSMR